jgi:hypothetical protein
MLPDLSSTIMMLMGFGFASRLVEPHSSRPISLSHDGAGTSPPVPALPPALLLVPPLLVPALLEPPVVLLEPPLALPPLPTLIVPPFAVPPTLEPSSLELHAQSTDVTVTSDTPQYVQRMFLLLLLMLRSGSESTDY